MGSVRPRPWWRNSPPLATVATFGLLFGAVALLGAGASTGTASSRAFVVGVPWGVWRIAAGAVVVLSVALFVVAVEILRSGQARGLITSPRLRRRYLVMAALAVLAFALFLILAPRTVPSLPIRGQDLRTGAIQIIGLASSVPWLAIVWLAAAECNDLADQVLDLPAGGLPAAGSGEMPRYRTVVEHLLDLWDLLIDCVTAFAVAVVAAIVTTGALRGAFLSAYPAHAAQFPPADVLFYGGFFALVLSVITLPLAISWRAQARGVVERTYPLPADGQPTEAWMSARTRLEHLLHLDVSVLRNPLTALSIFTPLITAVLAAFIPQLTH